ncbi:DUF4184 family protein [Microbacterium lushaniae]|nr:DUF4184 family protein [Microbacterium lushaniae]
MPLTPSHAVVALAFVRTPLVPAAIAVGAMTPDLPLFVRVVVPGYGVTHDLAWLPVTVALALGLLLIWRMLLRPAVRELAPRAIAARLPRRWDASAADGLRETFAVGASGVSWPALGLVVLSLAIGVVTHVGWDLFTHAGRGGVDLVPVLAQRWGPLPGYTWLQHGSSVLGLAILAAWGLGWLSRRRPAPVDRVLPAALRMAWWVSLPVVLISAWLVGLAVLGPLDADFTAAHLAYRVLPPACAVWGLATAALCAGILVRRRAGAPR